MDKPTIWTLIIGLVTGFGGYFGGVLSFKSNSRKSTLEEFKSIIETYHEDNIRLRKRVEELEKARIKDHQRILELEQLLNKYENEFNNLMNDD